MRANRSVVVRNHSPCSIGSVRRKLHTRPSVTFAGADPLPSEKIPQNNEGLSCRDAHRGPAEAREGSDSLWRPRRGERLYLRLIQSVDFDLSVEKSADVAISLW